MGRGEAWRCECQFYKRNRTCSEVLDLFLTVVKNSLILKREWQDCGMELFFQFSLCLLLCSWDFFLFPFLLKQVEVGFFFFPHIVYPDFGFPPSTPPISSLPPHLSGSTTYLSVSYQKTNTFLMANNEIKYKTKLTCWYQRKQTKRRKRTEEMVYKTDPLIHTLNNPIKKNTKLEDIIYTQRT